MRDDEEPIAFLLFLFFHVTVQKSKTMKSAYCILSAACLLAVALASPVQENISVVEQQQTVTTTLTDRAKYEEELLRKLNNKCSSNDLSSCVMLKLVTYMNKLLKKASIELTDDIEIRKTSQATEEVVSFQTGRAAVGDEDSEVFDLIASKVYAFVKSRSIKWRFLPEDDVVVSAKEDETGSLNLGLSIERSENAVQDGNYPNCPNSIISLRPPARPNFQGQTARPPPGALPRKGYRTRARLADAKTNRYVFGGPTRPGRDWFFRNDT